ncbi:MAG TPA: hypothetical protein DDX03_04610, partial [Firmicutes bacterium]|nr:hypothetical protein [Bacillota bacterium]
RCRRLRLNTNLPIISAFNFTAYHSKMIHAYKTCQPMKNKVGLLWQWSGSTVALVFLTACTPKPEEINAVVENFMEQWKAGNAANMT